jgi:acetylornithine deacetylase
VTCAGAGELDASAIDAWLDAHRTELFDLLSELVATRSDVSPPIGREAGCQKVVEAAYRQVGLEVDVFDPADVPALLDHPLTVRTWDGMDRPLVGRPDVVGTLRGGGGGRSLLVSSHVDTVPAIAEEWASGSPFSGRVVDRRLYGRGSWDTKWGIAAGLFTARCVKELGLRLRGDLIVESVVDEEFGGSHGTLAARLRGHNADVAINCEPTSLVVGTAHRGGGEWRITVRGDERGLAFGEERSASAVQKLASTIRAIWEWNEYRNRTRIPNPEFADSGDLPACIMQVTGGGHGYGDVTGAPAECSLLVWVEEEPGVDEAQHRAAFTSGVNDRLRADAAFDDGVFPAYQPTIRYLPGSSADLPADFTAALSQAFTSTGHAPRYGGVPLAADTYVFNLYAATPAITLGPRGGNAHAADEFVELDDVVDLVRVLTRTAVAWCA